MAPSGSFTLRSTDLPLASFSVIVIGALSSLSNPTKKVVGKLIPLASISGRVALDIEPSIMLVSFPNSSIATSRAPSLGWALTPKVVWPLASL